MKPDIIELAVDYLGTGELPDMGALKRLKLNQPYSFETNGEHFLLYMESFSFIRLTRISFRNAAEYDEAFAPAALSYFKSDDKLTIHSNSAAMKEGTTYKLHVEDPYFMYMTARRMHERICIVTVIYIDSTQEEQFVLLK